MVMHTARTSQRTAVSTAVAELSVLMKRFGIAQLVRGMCMARTGGSRVSVFMRTATDCLDSSATTALLPGQQG